MNAETKAAVNVYNEILSVESGVATILLNDGHTATVDAEDLPTVTGYRWHLSIDRRGNRYVRASVPHGLGRRGQHVLMHRLLMGLVGQSRPLVDHQDSDGTNNTRANLRRATFSQNAVNVPLKQGHYRGVVKHGKKYRAVITRNRKNLYFGPFSTAEEAARVRDAEAKKHFGEFAALNFPEAKK